MFKSLLGQYYLYPEFIKKLLFNLEAIRRNQFRRSKNYFLLSKNLSFNSFINVTEIETVVKLNDLIRHASHYVPFYKKYSKYSDLRGLNDLHNLPILSKDDIRSNLSLFYSTSSLPRSLWKGSTSGSTGSPLKFYKDPNSILLNQLLYDKYYGYIGCDITKKRVRFSGIKVLPFEKSRPPFWIYIDKYKQLQCSVYHIGPSTFLQYYNKLKSFKGDFGTGLPSAWAELARNMNLHNLKISCFKAIVTDSEELKKSQYDEIQSAFMCPVYSTYGLGEVGMFAVQCENLNHHIIPYTHVVEIIDHKGNKVPDGQEGEIVVTDLYSHKAPFVRYRTGDLGAISTQDCGCTIHTPFLTRIIGRVEDFIETKDGRRFSRVSLIVKKAKNIKESQIIQLSKEDILIKVVPDVGFNPDCMIDVLKDAHLFLGDMKVQWMKVDQLERMPSGKVKFLVKAMGNNK